MWPWPKKCFVVLQMDNSVVNSVNGTSVPMHFPPPPPQPPPPLLDIPHEFQVPPSR